MGIKNKVTAYYIDRSDYSTVVSVLVDLDSSKIKVLEDGTSVAGIGFDKLKKVKSVEDLGNLLNKDLKLGDFKVAGKNGNKAIKLDEYMTDNVGVALENDDDIESYDYFGGNEEYTQKMFRKQDIYGVADTVKKATKLFRWVNICGNGGSGRTTLALNIAKLLVGKKSSDRMFYINVNNGVSDDSVDVHMKYVGVVSNFCKTAAEEPDETYVVVIDNIDTLTCTGRIDQRIESALKHKGLDPLLEIPDNVRFVTTSINAGGLGECVDINLRNFMLDTDKARPELSDECKKLLKVLYSMCYIACSTELNGGIEYRSYIGTDWIYKGYETVDELLDMFIIKVLPKVKELIEDAVSRPEGGYLTIESDGLIAIKGSNDFGLLECYNALVREVLNILTEARCGKVYNSYGLVATFRVGKGLKCETDLKVKRPGIVDRLLGRRYNEDPFSCTAPFGFGLTETTSPDGNESRDSRFDTDIWATGVKPLDGSGNLDIDTDELDGFIGDIKIDVDEE